MHTSENAQGPANNAASVPVQGGAMPVMDRLEAEGWISVATASERLGVARKTIYRWIDTAPLTAQRVGRRMYVRVADFATVTGEIGMRLLRGEI